MGSEVTGYHGFSITGRSGPVKYDKSAIIEKKLVPTGPLCKFYKGFDIEIDKWDTSDFFIPSKSRGTIITKKAADVLKKNKITNLRLENIADIEIDVTYVKK